MRHPLLSSALLWVCLTALPVAAQGCRQALILGLDVSLSVDTDDFRLQREGLAAALTDEAVVQGMIAPGGGHVELAIFEWTSTFNQTLLVDWTVIDNTANLRAIANDLRRLPQGMRSGRTAIGAAMLYARDALASRTHCLNWTVDLSGDGPNNTGPFPQDVRAELLAAGITLNALVIEDDAFPGLPEYFRVQVIAGPGAFVERVDSFANYERAMKRKLLREVTPSLSRRAPRAGGQPLQRPVPYAPADQPQGRMPHMRRHPPHLPIAPFRQGDLKPGVGHALAISHRWVARP